MTSTLSSLGSGAEFICCDPIDGGIRLVGCCGNQNGMMASHPTCIAAPNGIGTRIDLRKRGQHGQMYSHHGSIDILHSDQRDLIAQLLHGIKMMVALDAYPQNTTALDHIVGRRYGYCRWQLNVGCSQNVRLWK